MPEAREIETANTKTGPSSTQEPRAHERPREVAVSRASPVVRPGPGGLGAAGRAIGARSLQRAVGNARLARMVEPASRGQGVAPVDPPSGTGSLPPSVTTVLQSGGGQGVEPQARVQMERQFGQNFSGVRVHTGEQAAQAANDIGAQAFTHGQNIYFGAGKYQPGSRAGDTLLAHELAHTVQQKDSPSAHVSAAGSSQPGPAITQPGDALEQEAERAASMAVASPGAGILQRTGGTVVAPHRVAATHVNRHTALELWGDGTPANPGHTLDMFVDYTREQADWFVEPSLNPADRADLWALLLKTREGPHIQAGAGNLRLTDLRPLSVPDWNKLAAFGRACDPGSHTVRVQGPPAHPLAQRLALGDTVLQLESVVPGDVLEITVSEAQLVDVQAFGLVPAFRHYWTTFHPHLQQGYARGPAARAAEFQLIIDLLRGVGIAPFMTLLGRIRNLHRFTVPTLVRLVANYADTSRLRQVHLVLHTGVDTSGAFLANMPMYEALVMNPLYLTLFLEGQGSLAAITAQIPVLAATYGKFDASGTPRIAQAMIAGHGQATSLQLAGTGAPTVNAQREVNYGAPESLDTVANTAATDALLDTLLRSLDPATARVVYFGCLVGSNQVPVGTAAAAIPAHVASHPNLGAYTRQRAAAIGLPGSFEVQAARASMGAGGVTSLRDPSGNLSVAHNYTFDPLAFGTAVAYVASGHEPQGLLRAAVEVAATSGPVVAANQLRLRLTRPDTVVWWDEITRALVNVALAGVAVGAGVDVGRLNILANIAHIPFLARFGEISVAHFVGWVNSQPTVAGNIYTQIAAGTTFTGVPDANARIMRLVLEQSWIAFGGRAPAALVTYLDTTLALTAELIEPHLDTGAIAASAPALFPPGAPLTAGRIRLALAWLRRDHLNPHARQFLDAQVSVVAGRPALSGAVRAQLGGITEQSVLEALGRLTATTTVTPSGGGAPVELPNANAEVTGDTWNRVRVEPRPYIATVLPYGLNVRRLPSMRGAVFAVLHRGGTVHVMGFTHDWAAIDRNGRLGFVYRTFLSPPP